MHMNELISIRSKCVPVLKYVQSTVGSHFKIWNPEEIFNDHYNKKKHKLQLNHDIPHVYMAINGYNSVHTHTIFG